MSKELNQKHDIVLNYIDKIHISLQSIGKKLNRTIIFLLLVNILLLAIEFKLISISNSFTFLGFVIEMSTITLSVVLCVCCYFLQVYMFGLSVKESENSDMIINLYKKMGFYDESLNLEDACVLEFPHVLNIAYSKRMKKNGKWIGRLNDSGFMISSFIVLVITPIILGFVLYGMVINLSWNAWESITVMLILLLSVINTISGFAKGFSY